MRVVRRPLFVDDLAQAYTWIARESERAADRLLDRVEATVERLRQFPLIGAPRYGLAPDLRSIRVRPFPHLICYRASREEIVLIRLLHGARDLQKQEYGA